MSQNQQDIETKNTEKSLSDKTEDIAASQSKTLDTEKHVFGFGFTKTTFNNISQKTSNFLDKSCEESKDEESDKEDDKDTKKHKDNVSTILLLDHIPTGEEDEKTVFQSRCKLFVMHVNDDSWKEKGTGTIHVNHDKKSKNSRLVMRTDGTLKLILNTSITSAMSPILVQEKNVRLTALYGSQSNDNEMILSLLLLRFKNASEASQFLDQLRKLINIPNQ